jgi:hypothetical protein
MSVDLPEPETPVMATSLPSGISAVTPRRLCSRALTMRMTRLSSRVSAGRGVSGASIGFAGPLDSTRPPNSPAPGPSSML